MADNTENNQEISPDDKEKDDMINADPETALIKEKDAKTVKSSLRSSKATKTLCCCSMKTWLYCFTTIMLL